jgi:alkylation response protein AidB-like acyl-CoA dehydrogenase
VELGTPSATSQRSEPRSRERQMDPERQALREAVRGLLAKHSSSSAVRAAIESPPGYDRPLWTRLCTEIGVAGLAIPERYGGAGASLLEAHIVLGELGGALTPSPMLGCAVLAAQAVLHSGDEGACQRLLPGIAAGNRIAALAWTPQAGGWDPQQVAYTAAGNETLTGEAHYVLDAETADTLLVAASDKTGIGLYEVDADLPGVTRTAVTTMDLTRRLTVVGLDGVPGRRLGTGNPLDLVRDIACVALSAEQVGAASRAFELTVAYTKTRVQFGQPIGAFQALQHRLADLHVLVESARSASYAAASAAVAGTADAPLLAAVAKVHCSEALERVAGEMIQLHGGIGVTWEHDAHLYFKRAHSSLQLFGSPRSHVCRLAASLLGG